MRSGLAETKCRTPMRLCLKGYTGWIASHDEASEHIDDLVERLENVLEELRAL